MRGEIKETAAQLKKEWDTVLKPEGRPPYFDRAQLPEINARAEDFDPGTAWMLVELSRLIYTRSLGEARGERSKCPRFEVLERIGLREVASFGKSSNHAALYEPAGENANGPYTILCYRGTRSAKQWMMNLTTFPVKWKSGGYVHQGFKILFEELWTEIRPEVERAKEKGPVIFTGHSLGGALAMLAAATLSPTSLYTFGAPRVGNQSFRAHLRKFPAFRVVDRHDIVTLLPHSVEKLAPYDFHHAGELHYLTGEGEIVMQPSAEDLAEDEARGKQPLTFLMESFKSPQPPACMMDHAPISYVRELGRGLE